MSTNFMKYKSQLLWKLNMLGIIKIWNKINILILCDFLNAQNISY